jgi:hypothetical protein
MPNVSQTASGAASAEPSTGTSISTPRSPTGFAATATKLFEAVGVLNKGSAGSAATPKVEDAAQTAGVSSNTLNVTRVGGLTAVIAGAGAAAIAIFNVNKATDRASIVVAAYVSVGVIVASALLTAAIIISADIRARVAVNPPAVSSSGSAAGVTPPAAGASPAKTQKTDAGSFDDAWYRALSMLHYAVDRLERTPEAPVGGWVDGSTAAWLDAAASTGKTQDLKPADDAQSTLHARLKTGQASVVALLEKLVNDQNPAATAATLTRTRSALDSMDLSLPWPN